MLLIFSLVFALGLSVCACKGDSEPAPVLIDVPQGYDGKTLKECMEYWQEEGSLSFTFSAGMVTAINGTKNAGNKYWMLYTDDRDNSDSSWGTAEHGGKTYFSASSGVAELVVKGGFTYIWVYRSF